MKLSTLFLNCTLIAALGLNGQAEEKAPKLSEQAQKVVNKMNARIVEIQNEAIEELIKLGKIEAKRGKLDEVLAIKKQVEELQSQQSLLAPKPAVDPLIGKWRCGKVSFTFFENGTWSTQHNDFGGSWKRLDDTFVELKSVKGNNQTFKVKSELNADWAWNGGKPYGRARKLSNSTN